LRTSIGIDCSRREKVAAVIALDPGLPPSGPRPSTVEVVFATLREVLP
jgi:hypothetical protein